jgi:VanZ family protein
MSLPIRPHLGSCFFHTKSIGILYLFLVLSSYLGCFHVETYCPIGNQLLINNSFSFAEQGWETKFDTQEGTIGISPNHITIATFNTPTSLKVAQIVDAKKLSPNILLKATAKNSLLKATAKNSQISVGKRSWDLARIILVQFENDKAIWSRQHSLVSLSDLADWTNYSKVFPIAPTTDYIVLRLEINNSIGNLEVKNIQLYNAIKNPTYINIQLDLFIGWGVFACLLFFPYIRQASLPSKLLMTTVIIVLIFGITMDYKLKNDLRSKVTTTIKSTVETITTQLNTPQKPDPPITHSLPQTAPISHFTSDSSDQTPHHLKRPDITKVAHFLLFMALGFILLRNGAKSVRHVLIDLLMLASMTEILQLFIEGRSALWDDVGIDFAGGFFGVGAAVVWLFFMRMRGRKERGEKR